MSPLCSSRKEQVPVAGQSVSIEDVPVPLLEVRGTTIAAASPTARALIATASGAPRADVIGLDLAVLVDPGDRAALVGLLVPDDAAQTVELAVRLGTRPGRPVLLRRRS